MRYGSDASHVYTADEAQAMREQFAVEAERTAMGVGTGSTGGFGVPAQLDPTIVLRSDGSVNPLRELASHTTISTSEWKGITSLGVSAEFTQEGTEMAEATVTLEQPSIIPERLDISVLASWEILQDWGSIQSELGRLFQDAKDQKENERFTLGAGHGSFEPEGLIAGLAAASVVTGAGTALFALADVYTIQEALPPRFQPKAKWLSTNATMNKINRFVPQASATEPGL